MPNKYQREIEEILRNMERTEPRSGLGNRIRAFNRPRERTPRQTRIAAPSSEVLMLVGIVLALIAAGLAFEVGDVAIAGVPLTGVLAVIGFVFLAAGLVVGWRGRFRPLAASKPTTWRDDNVIEMTPRSRGPLANVNTQMRILRLKLRYWRTHRRGEE